MENRLWRGKKTTLPPQKTLKLRLSSYLIRLHLTPKDKLHLHQLSPWYKFAKKDRHYTKKLYAFDPVFYNPQKPTSTARKLVGQNEPLRFGSIRNPLFFGSDYKPSPSLAPEHAQIVLNGKILSITNLSGKPITIHRIKP